RQWSETGAVILLLATARASLRSARHSESWRLRGARRLVRGMVRTDGKLYPRIASRKAFPSTTSERSYSLQRKFEYRNPKQIRMFEFREFPNFEPWDLFRISDIRISDFFPRAAARRNAPRALGRHGCRQASHRA